MHSMFNRVDTFDASTYAFSIDRVSSPLTQQLVAPNTETFSQQMVLPVIGLEFKGQPVMAPGFGRTYGLYLTIDDSGITATDTAANLYTSFNVTLWADPQNDAGAPRAAMSGGLTFPNNANDVVLAAGTLLSATTSLDQATETRTDTYVETMTPTLDDTQLLGGSLPAGSHLTEKLTTPSSVYQKLPTPAGAFFATTNGGSATITSDAGAILIPSKSLQLSEGAGFIHHR